MIKTIEPWLEEIQLLNDNIIFENLILKLYELTIIFSDSYPTECKNIWFMLRLIIIFNFYYYYYYYLLLLFIIINFYYYNYYYFFLK
jgi:hypothetical protein